MYIDKPKFMRDFLRIAAKGEKEAEASLIIPFSINRPQEIYLKEKTDRNIILKSRQLGFSTIILADFFVDVITTRGLAASVISYGDTPTSRLLTKVHRFYNECPKKNFFPEIYHQSDHLMSFPKLDSSFYIGSSRAAVVGRGETIHRCHLSEFAFYNKANPGRAEEIMSEVGQAVPLGTGVLTVESSPYTRNDPFFNLYFGAKEHDNNFTAFFFPWWWGDDYVLPANKVPKGHEEDLEENLKLTPEEMEIVSKYNLNHDQIRWRRYKIRELGRKFLREYSEDDQTCWLNPDTMVFSMESVERLMRLRLSPIDHHPAEYMTVWENPDGGELYVIGADVAEGLPTGDWSTASVLKVSNGTKVASIRAKVPIDVFAQILARVGKDYNYALLTVEANAHGVGVLKTLENLGYPNIYWKTDEKGKPIKMGWTTTLASRPQMIDDFDRALRSGAYRTSDEQELTEIQEFVMLEGKMQGMDTDDALFASMIAWQVRDQAMVINANKVLSESYVDV